MYYGFHQALDYLLTEGFDASLACHLATHRHLRAGMEEMGFTPHVKEGGVTQFNLFLRRLSAPSHAPSDAVH